MAGDMRPGCCDEPRVLGGGGSSGVPSGAVGCIEVPFAVVAGAMPAAPIDSATSIPVGARVSLSQTVVDVAFSGGALPTLAVSAHGAADTTLQAAATDNDLTIAGQYDVGTSIKCLAGATGPVRLTFGGTATAGSGRVVVYYSIPQG